MSAGGADTPWPAPDVVRKLVDGVQHLLQDHGCDMHGHEELRRAMIVAREWLREQGYEP